MSTPPDALVACLMEIERHVGELGWDQPARLFALVPTRELMAAEPALAAHLGAGSDAAAHRLSAIEQEGFHPGTDLGEALARLAWPPTVAGVALALERSFLTAAAEADLGGSASAEAVAAHPARQDIRVVVAALRDGAGHGVARLKNHPDELLAGPDLVPGLGEALARTLD
jgi:hypothetical protein